MQLETRKTRTLLALTVALAALAAAWSALAAPLPYDIDLGTASGNEGTDVRRLFAPEGTAMNAGNNLAAIGDINGDGLEDVVLGYPNGDGDTEGESNNGRIFVHFGSKQRAPLSGNLTEWPFASVHCTDAGALYGSSIAVGDVDGDGLDDVVAGAPGADNGKGAVIFVSGAALSPGTSLSVAAVGPTAATSETRFNGSQDGASLGYAVAVADTNQDGKAEILMGEPEADLPSKTNAGRVYLVFGADVAAGSVEEVASFSPRWEVRGSDGSRLGAALATGDIDGDGYPDLVLGAPDYDSTQGTLVVIPAPGGGSAFLGIDVVQDWTGMAFVGGVPSLGFSVDTGDVNRDGFDDIVAGAPLFSKNEQNPQCGLVGVFYGRSGILGNNYYFRDGNQTGETELWGPTEGSRLGTTVAVGDVDGDGQADVLAGSAFERSADGTQAMAGRLEVFRGLHLSESIFDALGGNVTIFGPAEAAFYSASIAAQGDLDGDGFADLVATAPFEASDVPNATGNTYIIYGGGDAAAAEAVANLHAGDTTERGIGGRLSPTVRARVQFEGGTAGYLYGTLHRNREALSNIGLGGVEPVSRGWWELETTRTGWTNAHVILQYTDAEIEQIIQEDAFALMTAQQPEGPWTPVAGWSVDAAKNEVSFTTQQLGLYAMLADSPVITLMEEAEQELECGNDWTDPGFIALSATEGDLTSSVVVGGDAVDSYTAGVYVVTYNVMDSNMRPALEVIRTVHIVDTTPPDLELNGSSFPTIECGTVYAEAGANVWDSCEGDLSAQVLVAGDAVDTTTPGTYTLTYNLTDAAGNSSAQQVREVTVADTLAPVIELVGAGTISIACGEPFVDPGATASDTCDGDLTNSIEIAGQVDVNSEGSYVLLYNVQDAAGHPAETLSRVVNVGACLEGEGTPEGEGEGSPEGEGEGSPEGEGEGTPEGEGEGTSEGEGEGTPEGEGEGEAPIHTGDWNADNSIDLSELLRIVQLYNFDAFQCDPANTEDGFGPGTGNVACTPHSSDYDPQDWTIDLGELLRSVQFYNIGGFHPCIDGEDGFCPNL